jgi:outer membrane receptor for ferrienterochelin and colicin
MKLKNPLRVEGFLLYIVTMLRITVFFLFLLIGNYLLAQPAIDSLLLQREIVKLLNIDSLEKSNSALTSLIGFSERDSREIPGDILVVSSEEIESMNAIDLMEVLIHVAATSLGRDVEDALGAGIRGMWAQEGKVLFMFNGIPLNDLDYGTYVLGGRTPLHMVSRIEFNFGPGSVKYGGTAALGVINVVLKSNSEFSGGSVRTDYSISNGANDRRFIGFMGNYELNDNYQMTIQVNSGSTKKSTRIQEYSRGNDLNWADSSNVDCNNVFIGLRKGKYKGAFYYSDYQSQVSDEAQQVLMSTLGLDNSLNFKIKDKTRLEVQLTYMDQLPWIDINTADSSLMGSNTHAQRINQNIVFKSKFGKNFNLDYGVQGSWQRSKILMRRLKFDYNGQNELEVGSGALFVDGFYKGKLGALSFGSRLETHTFSPLLFAPRIGYSFSYQNFYFKTFFAQSFKIATIQNQNSSLNGEILDHETINSVELEMGMLYRQFNFKVSAFRTKVFNPIIYVYEPVLEVDNYLNRDLLGTEGVQFTCKYTGSKIKVYSYGIINQVIRHDLIDEMQGDQGQMYFGFPSYKFHMHGSLSIMKQLSVNAGLTKQGQFYYHEDENFENGYLVQVGMNAQLLKNRNLHLSMAVKNLMNSDFWVTSPTNTSILPMPLLSRQFQISLQYLFYQ